MSRDPSIPAAVVMAKVPDAGRTKTRLVPPLTHEVAAELYECFLRDTLDYVRAVPHTARIIATWPPGSEDYFARIAPDFERVAQLGDRLAERLDHVLTTCLADGYGPVVAVSSDSPTLPPSRLVAAFETLNDQAVDMVLGPADDGGYYLIGWKRALPHVVHDVAMSTPRVLADTLELADASDLRVALLDPWYDVDNTEDLERLAEELSSGADRRCHTRSFLEAHHLVPR